MRKIFTQRGVLAALMLVSSVVNATPKGHMPLDRIVFQVADEAWVSTKSAEVIASVNATLDKAGLAKVRQQMLDNLQHIAKAQWHITSFNRSQDSSGLERISVMAQARVPEQQLGHVRQQANKVSRPGATYRVIDIQFTPTLEEVQQTRSTLREDLYRKVNAEVERLNKVFPEQNYSVHNINFTGMVFGRSREGGNQAYRMKAMAMQAQAAPALSVSNKVTEQARVVIAANRDQGGKA